MGRASSGVPLVWLVWLQAGPGAGSLGTSHWPRNRRGEQWHLYRIVVWYLFRIFLIVALKWMNLPVLNGNMMLPQMVKRSMKFHQF